MPVLNPVVPVKVDGRIYVSVVVGVAVVPVIVVLVPVVVPVVVAVGFKIVRGTLSPIKVVALPDPEVLVLV